MKKQFLSRGIVIRSVKEAGYSLLEIMVALAIVAGVVFSVLSMSSIVGTDSKIQTFTADFMGLAAKVQTYYSNTNSFSGIEEQNLINAGLVPQGLYNPALKGATGTNAVFKTPWGEMKISSVDSNSGVTDGTFQFELSTLPQDVCNRLGGFVANSTFWELMSINGTEVYNVDNTATGNLIDSVATACATGNKNTITYQARRQ